MSACRRKIGLGVLVILVAACNQAVPPTATQTPVVIVVTATTPATAPATAPSETPEAAASATVAPTAAPTSAESSTPAATEAPVGSATAAAGISLLFGPFHLPEDDFAQGTFTGAFEGLLPATAKATLDKARAAHVRLVINLAGGRQGYQEQNGAFSVAAFKSKLDAFSGIDFAPYVADGTVMGHMMFDEPNDPNNWNGAPVPYKDIDAAAAYSKKLWPTLPAGVGGEVSWLAAGAPYSALDFGYSQFTAKRGNIQNFVQTEVAAGKTAHLGVLIGLNILGGGSGRGKVSATDLRAWVNAMLAEPVVCGILMWKYDASYLRDTNITAAMADLGKTAKARASHSCLPDAS